MKKRVIRLTESELKRYINKVVSEQMINKSTPSVDPTKTSVKLGDTTKKTNVWAEINGENPTMYYDPQKTKVAMLLNIIRPIAINADGKGVDLGVRDLRFVNTSNGYDTSDDKKEKIVELRTTCGSNIFYAYKEDGNYVELFCPGLTAAVSKALNCNQFKVNTTPKFSSNGGSKPSTFA
jgi:hypothetical protein